MSALVVVGFDNENTADQVLNKLAALQKEYLIDFADACVVVRDASGKIHLKQAINLVGTGAASGGAWGAMWGMLVGLLFLNPLAGLLTGGWARRSSRARRHFSFSSGVRVPTRSCPSCSNSRAPY
jgi:uncharacterized membrane protein